jgi:glutamate synthase (NADPH/NADH) small chain
MYNADLVLLAMGFLGPEQYSHEQLKMAVDARSNISTATNTYATSVPKVYAAGGGWTNSPVDNICLQTVAVVSR